MKKFGLYKKCKESFSIKVFNIFTVFIIIVSSVFTSFFVHHQTKNIKNDLTKRGAMLSGFLAYSSRTGVFAESVDLFKDAVQGVMSQEGVLSVSIFTANKENFFIKQKNSSHKRHLEIDDKRHKEVMAKLTDSQSLEIIEEEDTIEFLRPVTLETFLHPEEALYFYSRDIEKTEKIIGYVNVTLDKTVLNRTIRSILIDNTIIAVMFLLSGIIIIYITLKRVTKPLTVLTGAVKRLGLGESAGSVPVETEDEIGRLATAFNTMSENLRKREEEKRLLEEKLAQARKLEAIGQFAGGIAHDFNNRLAAMMNYGNILEMKIKEGDPLRGYVEQILTLTERAADLTQSLLVFSKRQEIHPKPVELNEFIRNGEKLLLKVIGEDIEFKTSLTDEYLPLMMDTGQMERVLINLAINAKDAMSGKGVLAITTELVKLDDEYIKAHGYGNPGMYARISVTDTGIGIDEKIKQRIFEPFFTTKEVGKGTGLGLSIVYGIIEQHNGYVNCYSESGKGTTFKIYLPLTKADVEEVKPLASVSPMHGTETLLIAENDSDIREGTKNILEKFGYKVIVAVDGEDAIAKFMENKDRIGFLLLDVVMPKKGGKEVYEEIRQIRPDIKALFTSGFTADVINKIESLEAGVNFISKPASPTELLRKVREALDKS